MARSRSYNHAERHSSCRHEVLLRLTFARQKAEQQKHDVFMGEMPGKACRGLCVCLAVADPKPILNPSPKSEILASGASRSRPRLSAVLGFRVEGLGVLGAGAWMQKGLGFRLDARGSEVT